VIVIYLNNIIIMESRRSALTKKYTYDASYGKY
jgi:hypothetical protein